MANRTAGLIMSAHDLVLVVNCPALIPGFSEICWFCHPLWLDGCIILIELFNNNDDIRVTQLHKQ